MNLCHRALVLFAAAPLLVPVTAEAAIIIGGSGNVKKNANKHYRISVVVDNDPDDEVASVELDVRSDAGSETLTLAESDAWLHGAVALSELPSEGAALSLTLYDTAGGTLTSFSGARLGGGSVTFTENAVVTCDTYTKLGCSSQEPQADVEVLAAELYPAEKGYELTLDLSGADTWSVAYADIVVTEPSGEVRAEVDWDAVGSVWQADATLEHTGVIDVKAKTRDADGDTLDNVSAELGEPWLDDGEGVNTLATDGDPLTRLAVTRRYFGAGKYGLELGLVSEGWTTGSYPTHAELEVAGETATVPANSYQRMRKRPELLFQPWDAEIQDYLSAFVLDPGSTISITSGSFQLEDRSASSLATPLCSSGTCVVLVESEEGYELSVTTYGQDAGTLPDKAELAVVLHDKAGDELASGTLSVEFDEEVVAVFANELEFEGDPTGLDASGGVSLLGAADSRGRQGTLAKGTFRGAFSVDGDGDLGLGGYGADEAARADTNFAVLLGGPVECGGDGCDGDWVPPTIVYATAGNGSGTKNASTTTSTRPQLL